MSYSRRIKRYENKGEDVYFGARKGNRRLERLIEKKNKNKIKGGGQCFQWPTSKPRESTDSIVGLINATQNSWLVGQTFHRLLKQKSNNN